MTWDTSWWSALGINKCYDSGESSPCYFFFFNSELPEFMVVIAMNNSSFDLSGDLSRQGVMLKLYHKM